MEHRCGTRHAVRVPVLLIRHGSPPVPALMCDISITGMFALLVPDQIHAPAFSPHQLVTVKFAASDNAEGPAWQAEALVVRTSHRGIGLAFDELRLPAMRSRLALATALESVHP